MVGGDTCGTECITMQGKSIIWACIFVSVQRNEGRRKTEEDERKTRGRREEEDERKTCSKYNHRQKTTED